jgi:hypothetical protein
MLDRINLTLGQTPTEADWENWFNRVIDYVNAGIPAADLAKEAGKVAISISGDAATLNGKTADEIVAGDFPEVKKTLIDALTGGYDLVLKGGACTKNGTTPSRLDITACSVIQKVASTGVIDRVDLSAAYKTSVKANTTYFLDVEASSEAFAWGESHPSGDYVPIATVTTDLNAEIATITDTRPLVFELFKGFDAKVRIPDFEDHKDATAGIHGATSAATASKLLIRDANGRAKVAAPSASDDIARKDTVDTHVSDNSKHAAYLGETTNSGNNYSITTTEEIPSNSHFIVKFNAASTGAATLNISSIGSAKGIKKPGGSDAIIKIGQYTLFYDGSNFQLLGEGGEYGTAGAAQVLTGYTYGSENGLQNGSMANRGAVNQSLSINGSYTIPVGYHNGSGQVTQSIPTKTAATITPNTAQQTIASGQYLSGTQTIDTLGGDAPVSAVLSGYTFSSDVAGRVATGAIAQKAAATYTPGTTDQTIASDQYLGGVQTIKGDANLTSSILPPGVTIFNVTGEAIASGDYVTVNISNEMYVSGSGFNGAFSPILTIKKAGTYKLKFSAKSSSASTSLLCRFKINGNTPSWDSVNCTDSYQVFDKGTMTFAVNDTIQLEINSNNGGPNFWTKNFKLCCNRDMAFAVCSDL